MNRLEKIVLIVGYAAILWGLLSMPSFALDNTADASFGSKIICTQTAELTETVVSIHDKSGWSVGKIESELSPDGGFGVAGRYAMAQARLAVLDDHNRDGLRERVWRQCLEDLN